MLYLIGIQRVNSPGGREKVQNELRLPPTPLILLLKKVTVCLVGVKIIFVENDFPMLRCLAKKEEKNYFQKKMIFPHMKENIFL